MVQPFFDDEVSDTTSESPTSVTDGAVSDFAEVAERDQISSLSTSESPTAVIDGAAGDFTGVVDVWKNCARDEPGQQLPVTKKGKKSKGKRKANDRSQAQAFAFRRQFFEEHRFAAKREGIIDLDVLATLSEGMNGRDLLDVVFLISNIHPTSTFNKRRGGSSTDFSSNLKRMKRQQRMEQNCSSWLLRAWLIALSMEQMSSRSQIFHHGNRS